MQDFVVNFVAQISNENVEVVRSIFLVRAVGLVSPVDTDFLQIPSDVVLERIGGSNDYTDW